MFWESALEVLVFLYKLFIICAGNLALFCLIGLVITNVIVKYMMKKHKKDFVEALKNNQFLNKSFEKMTEEEKENIDNNNKTKKKVTMNMNDMSVTETFINGETNGKTK